MNTSKYKKEKKSKNDDIESIDSINSKAKAHNMTYGQYVSLMYLQTMQKGQKQ